MTKRNGLTAAERQRRHRAEVRADKNPKHYLVEALSLFDRIDQRPPAIAHDLMHRIGLEAAKRKRHHAAALRATGQTTIGGG